MQLDRLLGILTILLQKDRVTAPELAERFEVNRRTIGRDIDALCRAGIPVVTHQGSGGGISIAEGFKLDKSVLTTDELSGMIAALKGIGSVSEQSNIERVLDKLRANSDAVISLREPVIIDLASHYKGQLTDKIELIKRAVRAVRSLSSIISTKKANPIATLNHTSLFFNGRRGMFWGFVWSGQIFGCSSSSVCGI